jgi:hypothetical protein
MYRRRMQSDFHHCRYVEGDEATSTCNSLYLELFKQLAEGEGFEPPEPFRVQWFSRPPPSTTRPSLRGDIAGNSADVNLTHFEDRPCAAKVQPSALFHSSYCSRRPRQGERPTNLMASRLVDVRQRRRHVVDEVAESLENRWPRSIYAAQGSNVSRCRLTSPSLEFAPWHRSQFS